jgi:putative endonuclease
MTAMRSKRQRHGRCYVYIVQCGDGTYYTGSTNNLGNRLTLHNAGNGAKYLRGKGPIRLVYAKEYRYYKNALHAERYLKRQMRRYKTELIQAQGVRISDS